MKKQLLSVLSFLMLCMGLQAQTNIANYTFARSAGTYVPLTGATTFSTSWDNSISPAIPLGGSFTFGAVTHTACFISSNGYITFGSAPAGTNYTPLSSGTFSAVISAFGQDGASSTNTNLPTPSISYMNIGGPTGEFVVQFTGHANYYNLTTEHLNFQIRLNLASGAVSIVYGSFTAPGSSTTGTTVDVGIRGNTTTWATNVNMLNTVNQPSGTTCTWADAITSVSTASRMLFSNVNTAIAPSNGLTLTWMPPINATLAPVRTFTAANTITATSANVAWTPATAATQYSVQYRMNTSCAWTDFSGNPVMTSSTTLTGLMPNTVYQYRVKASDGTNSTIWSHIPGLTGGTSGGYNNTTGSFATLPTCPAPSASTVTAITSNSASVTWTVTGSETMWDVYYGPTPLIAPTATTAPTATVSANNFSALGLNPATNYAFYVRANCGAGDMSSWQGPRSFSTSALPTDLQTTSLITPAVSSTGCYATTPVVVQIKNAGTSALDFATNNATVYGAVTGVNPQTFTTVVSTGTLAANATMNVTLTTTYNMSATGVYSINAGSTLSTPDANTSNDMMAQATRTTAASSTLPQMVNFTGYTAGTPANLSANFAGWNEATGAFLPTIGGDGSFFNSSTAQTALYSAAAKINLYNANNGWIISPKFVPTASHVFTYKATLIDFGGTTAVNFGTTDTVKAMISNDCGATWTALRTFNSSTNQGLDNTTNALRNYTENLSSYAGQQVFVAIMAKRGVSSTSPDIDFLIDDINIASCFPTTSITVTNILQTTADLSWTTPTNGSPANYIYEVRASGAAGSGTTGLVAAGTLVAPTTSVSLSGLTNLTSYSVYVQSDCGSGDMSVWSTVKTFTTLANCGVATAVTTTNVTGYNATISWTQPSTGTPLAYIYEIRTAGAAGSGTLGLVATNSVVGTSTMVTVTTLTPTTSYSVYIQTDCGGVLSLWTPAKTFTTTVSCPAPTALALTDIMPTTATASWTPGGAETSWYVQYAAPTTTAVASMPSYSLSGLVPTTAYTVSVKAVCATTNDSSVWVTQTFKTLCQPADIVGMGNSRCGTGTTTITATSTSTNASIKWYANATGGVSIATGTAYVTPAISANTTYYASSTDGLTVSNLGPLTPTTQGGTISSSSVDWHMNFNVINDVTLQSVDIFPTAAIGSVGSIRVTTSADVLISNVSYTTTVTGGALQTIPLNIPLTVGTGYKIRQGTAITLNRNTSGATYPYTSSSINITGNGFDPTYYYYFYNWQVSSGCESPRVPVTVTVTPAPAFALNTPADICGGSQIAMLNVTSTVSNFDSYVWTPTVGLYSDAAATMPYTGTSASTVYVMSNMFGTMNYNANATNSVTGCAAVASASIMVKEAPVNIMASVSPTVICANATVSLTSTTNGILKTVFTEDFNAATNSWTTTNTSTGGTVTAAAWTLQNSPYVAFTQTLSSNDATQFYLTNSDSQGSGSKTNTTLKSPMVNIAGLTTLNLEFNHYYRRWNTSDTVRVQVSTNGATWNTVKTYTATTGAPSAFALENIDLASYVGNSSLYLRFYYAATWGYGWVIDNVSLKGNTTSDYSYSWTANPTGFTSTLEKPTDMPLVSTTYSVAITNTMTGCSNSATVALTVNPSPTVTLVSSNTATVCPATSLTLTATSSASTFTWNPAVSTNSMATINPTTTTTYSVMSEAGGCVTTKTVQVAVAPNPTLNLVATNTIICLGTTSSASISATGSGVSYTWTPAVSTTSMAVVTPTATQAYIVSVANAEGCEITRTVTINVANTPVVTAIAPSAVCASSSVTLTSTGSATTYTWLPIGGNSSTAVVTPTGSTASYTLIGEANGCSNTSAVTLTVNALPTVSASSNPTIICSGQNAVLSATTTATTYTWSNNATTPSTTVSPTVTSNYTITVNDGTCKATAVVSVSVSACIGIEELSATGVSIYPNPNYGTINVTLTAELANNTTINVYDAIGKLVISSDLSDETTTISTNHLDAGVYFYQVINNNKAFKTGKLVKQ